MILYFNETATDPASAQVRSLTNNQPGARPTFVLGDNPTVEIHISDGAGGYSSLSGSATQTPWLGIGTPGGAPSGGTFWLGVSSATSGTLTTSKRYQIETYVSGDDFANLGAAENASGVIFTASGTTPTDWTNGSTVLEITAEIAYSASAATLEAALEATEAATGVSVTKNGTAPVFVVEWDAVGAESLLVGGPASLTPASAVVTSELRAGSASVTERQLVRLTRQPYALQTTWTDEGSYWSGTLDCNTRGLLDLLDGAPSAHSTLELQLVDDDGNIRTIAQTACLIRNEAIDEESTIPAPFPAYPTVAQTMLDLVQNRYAVTALTGGGTALDGIVTGASANPTVQTNSLVAIDISGAVSLYRLEAGSDSESSPAVIRPDDFDGTTNARVWKRQTVGGLSLYAENPSSPTTPVATGQNAVAIGTAAAASADASVAIGWDSTASAQSAIVAGGQTNTASAAYAAVFGGAGNIASAQSSVAMGEDAIADIAGQVSVGNGLFTSGISQCSTIPFAVTTSNSTPTELTSLSSGRLALRANTAWRFIISVIARRASGASHASWKIEGTIYRNSTAGSTAILGDVEVSPNSANEAGWDFTVSADTTNGALKMLATGGAYNVRWTAAVQLSEITYA